MNTSNINGGKDAAPAAVELSHEELDAVVGGKGPVFVGVGVGPRRGWGWGGRRAGFRRGFRRGFRAGRRW